jgi:hypothetical protein
MQQQLFESTIERLLSRVNTLESNAQENKDFKDIKDVGRNIKESRANNGDSTSMRLLEEMENNVKKNGIGGGGGGGGGSNNNSTRIAQGRIRPRQAF